MADTHLILHVKGTQSETKALPREDVRAGVWQGRISQSQLIWRPNENVWKPVRDLADLIPPVEHLILHVKGTEAETRQLPKPAVRAAISKGEITHSQLIWRPDQNTWKQVRELPELLPSQKLAPAPPPARSRPAVPATEPEAIIPESPANPVARAVAAAGAPPRVKMTSLVPTVAPLIREAIRPVAPQARLNPTPKAKPQIQAGAMPTVVPRIATDAKPIMVPKARSDARPLAVPQARVVSPGVAPVAKVATARPVAKVVVPVPTLTVKDKALAHPLRSLVIGFGLLLSLVIISNFLFVDAPLTSRLSATEFSGATVYGHLGAFIQPNVVIIHVRPSKMIIEENFTKFLVELAQSTPINPVTRGPFGRIALTSGWAAQYSFSGDSWRQLADMGTDSEANRKEFLMSQLDDASGNPLIPQALLTDKAQAARRDQVWQSFIETFAAKL